jgi:hypothetical protein
MTAKAFSMVNKGPVPIVTRSSEDLKNKKILENFYWRTFYKDLIASF